MRSKQLNLQQYNTEKVAGGLLGRYDPILQPLVHKELMLLELGINKGGSLLLWRDYFAKGRIVGIDIRMQCDLSHEERIRTFQGSQGDTDFLSRVAAETAPDGFDIIIDDACHRAELAKIAFWHLFTRHLKPGGLYVIEDWGTGYWDDWPDGKSFEPQLPQQNCDTQRYFPSHSYGMVGFIKQLVDEQGARALTRRQLTGKPERNSVFESMMIVPSIVFIKKVQQSIP